MPHAKQYNQGIGPTIHHVERRDLVASADDLQRHLNLFDSVILPWGILCKDIASMTEEETRNVVVLSCMSSWPRSRSDRLL